MPDFEQIGVEAVVAGMGPFRANASAYNAGILAMAGVTRTASAGINALGQIAIGAQRYIGQLAVDGFRLAAREALRFAENVISAAAAGTPLSRSLSTLYDHIQGIAKSQLAPFFDQLNGLVNRAAPAIESFTQFALGAFANLGSSALVWGENVINQFAQGMWNAVASVISALTDIANMVSYWLAPGSPPRLLPDLTNWGKGAVQAYLDGWTKGNFATFSELSGSIESFLRSLSTDVNDTGLIPRILGTREAIAQAVDQVRQTGRVTQDVLDGIFAAAGANTAAMQGYVKSVFNLELANANVAAAQNDLNKVTKEYNDLLKPIDDSLAAIGEEQAQLAEDNRISQLKLIANDPNATASEKRQAQLEIERILAERQRRAMLSEKAAAVDAAQAKLEAAQDAQGAAADAFDAQKAQLALNTQQNELIKAQIALLERLNKIIPPPAPPKPGGGGGKGGGPKPFNTDFDWTKLIPQSIWDRLADLQKAFETAWDAIVAALQPAIDAWNNLVVPAWQHLVNSIVSSWPAIKNAIGQMVAFIVREMGIVLPGVFANVAIALDTLAHIWDRHHDTIIAIVVAAFKIIFTTISVTLLLISGLVAVILNQISGFLDAWSLVFQGRWAEAWDQVKLTFYDSWMIIQDTLRVALDAILLIVGQDTDTFIKNWQGVWELAHIIVMTNIDLIREGIKAWTASIGQTIRLDMGAILTFWSGALETLRAVAELKLAAAQRIVEDVMSALATAVSWPLTAFSNLFQLFQNLWTWLQTHVFKFPEIPNIPGFGAPAGASSPAGAGVAAPAVAAPGYTVNNSTTYTLGGVSTGRQADSIIHEFAIMQVMAGIPA